MDLENYILFNILIKIDKVGFNLIEVSEVVQNIKNQ